MYLLKFESLSSNLNFNRTLKIMIEYSGFWVGGRRYVLVDTGEQVSQVRVGKADGWTLNQIVGAQKCWHWECYYFGEHDKLF